jgi:hypothetical protein
MENKLGLGEKVKRRGWRLRAGEPYLETEDGDGDRGESSGSEA